MISICCIQIHANNSALPEGDLGVVDADVVGDIDASKFGKEEKHTLIYFQGEMEKLRENSLRASFEIWILNA